VGGKREFGFIENHILGNKNSALGRKTPVSLVLRRDTQIDTLSGP
jgi:hypothetical protein